MTDRTNEQTLSTFDPFAGNPLDDDFFDAQDDFEDGEQWQDDDVDFDHDFNSPFLLDNAFN